MERIFNKVNNCLERYISGEIFFDELDKAMKFDKEILEYFIQKVKEEYEDICTIASGEFGLCLYNYNFPVDILVQGGLRKDNKICDLSNFIERGKKYLFLDDSYFSGRTAQIIKGEIERNEGIFLGCYVIYDGSYLAMHPIKSLYRYYDYFDILGRKKR